MFRCIFKNINILNPESVERQILRHDYYLSQMMLGRLTKGQRRQLAENQHGGSETKIYGLEFEGYTFAIYHYQNREGHDLSIKRHNDNENSTEYCLHISIDKDDNVAFISNISYYKECTFNVDGSENGKKTSIGLRTPGGGGTLLRLALAFLTKHKKLFKINKIRLMDTSTYVCGKTKISLPLMYSLTHGDTWYGKYGFRPCDPITGKIDKEMTKKYDKNKKIVMETKIRDTTLYGYMKKIIQKKDMSEKAKQKCTII